MFYKNCCKWKCSIDNVTKRWIRTQDDTEASVATCDIFYQYLKEQIMEEIDADKVYIISLYKVGNTVCYHKGSGALMVKVSTVGLWVRTPHRSQP